MNSLSLKLMKFVKVNNSYLSDHGKLPQHLNLIMLLQRIVLHLIILTLLNMFTAIVAKTLNKMFITILKVILFILLPVSVLS